MFLALSPLVSRISQEGEYRGAGTKVVIQPTADFIHHIMTIRDPAKLTKLGRDIQPGKPEAAVAYFQRAVDLGYADAYGELAFCHLYRRGIPSLDPDIAYKLAEQGFRFSSPIATSALAFCYQKGTDHSLWSPSVRWSVNIHMRVASVAR
jgi:TPR repeat protein